MRDDTGRARQQRGVLSLWRSLWRRLSPGDVRRLQAAAVAMLVGSALTAILPVLFGRLVDDAVAGDSVTLAGAAGPLAEIALLVLVSQLLQVVRRQLVEAVATGFERDCREAAYRHLMRLDLDVMRASKSGSLYGRANRSIEGAVKLIRLGAMDLLPAVTLAVSALVVVLTRGVLVTAAMVMVIPTGFALVRWQVRSQAGIRLQLRDVKEEVDGDVIELLPAMEVVRTTGADRHFLARIRAACGRLRATELRHHRMMSLFDAAKALNEGLWLVVTLAVAVQLTASGSISAGEVTTYMLLYAGVTMPLRELHRIIDEAAESAQQTTDLLDLLDLPEDQSYRTAATRSLAAVPRPALPGAGAIVLDHVRFQHAQADTPVLDGLSLAVAPGERVGIVGGSGCGKSTLLKLIVRLLHEYEGTIAIDGEDVRSLDRATLNERIAYVAQDPRLFRGTVADNIVLGREGVTSEEVVRAAQRAHVHDDVMRMPDGYATVVGERGETLSGGQRQRICLARGLLRTPPVLLLDEPTSALDGPSQQVVQRAIDDLTDVTLLVVAHRLGTLRTMDRIVVVERGAIAEQGSFAQLAASGGRFEAMLATQGERAA